MAQYIGPCNRCGEHVERRVKAGKEPLCLECAVRKMVEQQQGCANGTHPTLARSREAGERTRDALRARRGATYERWVAGVRRDLDAKATTQGETSDTFPA